MYNGFFMKYRPLHAFTPLGFWKVQLCTDLLEYIIHTLIMLSTKAKKGSFGITCKHGRNGKHNDIGERSVYIFMSCMYV